MSRIKTDELRDAVLDQGTFVSWDTTPLTVPTSPSYTRELAMPAPPPAATHRR